MFVRCGGFHRGAGLHSVARADRSGLALLSAGHQAGAVVRIPSPRALRTQAGPPLQCEQGLIGSVRQAAGTRHPVGRRDVRLPRGRSEQGSFAGRPRQCCLCAAGVGHGAGIPLARRPPAAHSLAQDRDLRIACQGIHLPASGSAEGVARNLCRVGDSGGDFPSEAAWRNGGRTDAGPSSCRRPALDRARVGELLGLQHAVVLRAGYSVCLVVISQRGLRI